MYVMWGPCIPRALDKREYLVIIQDHFCFNFAYVVSPHLNHLDKMVQIRGHIIPPCCILSSTWILVVSVYQI